MVDLAEVDSSPQDEHPIRRRTRRFWIILAVVVVLVGGAVIALTAVSLRYLHAAPLSSDGGGWMAPDNQHARDVRAGPYDAAVIAPRPGHAQTFEVEFTNFSPVSQTILGLADGEQLGNPRETGEPLHLAVSANSVFPPSGRIRYVSGPVTIAPGATYRLRLTHDTARDVWRGDGCRSEYWDGLTLRMRVGVFTRTERLDFDNLVFEIRGPGRC